MIDNYALKIAQEKQKMYKTFTLPEIVLCLDFEYGIKSNEDEVYDVLCNYGLKRIHGDSYHEYYALKG